MFLQQLTRAEEELMTVLWYKKFAFNKLFNAEDVSVPRNTDANPSTITIQEVKLENIELKPAVRIGNKIPREVKYSNSR